MNSLLFCFLTFFVSPVNDSLCLEQFYEKAVMDTSRYGPFIKVEVLQEQGLRKTVLWQSRLVYRKRTVTGESFEMYKSFMKDLLRQRRLITAGEFEQYGGNVVNRDR